MKGSQHLNKFISDKKKRARRVLIFPGLFGMCQKVTRTSQNMQMLSSYIPFNHIILWLCVQFIEIKNSCWGNVFKGSEKAKRATEKPVPIQLVFMLSSGPNIPLMLSQAMQKQRVHIFHWYLISKLYWPQNCLET